MKKSIVLLILLLAACKQTETTNETTTTMTVTESSATVATIAPTTPAPLPVPPAPATAAIETMGTNPAAKPVTATTPAKPATATTATAPSTAAPAPAPAPAPVPTPAPPAPATAAIETMGTNPAANVGSQGADIFKAKNCALCHGASGAGDTAMGTKNNIHDFHSAAVQSQTDEQLVKTIREGKGPVSASAHKSKALSAEQARSVVAWIRTLK
jgi:mono/diheme cytochrome c family protein